MYPYSYGRLTDPGKWLGRFLDRPRSRQVQAAIGKAWALLCVMFMVGGFALVSVAMAAQAAKETGLVEWARGMNQRAVSEEFPTAYVMLPANMIGNEFPWTLEAKCEKTRVFTDVELECRVIGTIKGEKP